MGNAAPVGTKKKFMTAAENKGFYKRIMSAKTTDDKVAVFEEIKKEVQRWNCSP